MSPPRSPGNLVVHICMRVCEFHWNMLDYPCVCSNVVVDDDTELRASTLGGCMYVCVRGKCLAAIFL